MNRYELSSQIGDGSFGRVMKATSKETGNVVAIKHIKRKFKTWKACIDLREVQSLRMTRHPNIVRMMEVIRERDESLYFVFEYLPDGTLYDLIKNSNNTQSLTTQTNESNSKLNHQSIIRIMKQILSGLAHMNSKGFFHRDIKPENILIHLGNKESQDVVVKIADFGLARPISSPPFTYYVSTRWYRAPEVILHAPNYGPPVDLFACGLILSELYTLRPMFPGTSEVDQMHVMARLLGSPEDSWGEGMQLMKKLNMNLPCTVENVSDDAIEEKILQSIRGEKAAANLICKLIRWNPNERPTTKEALSHEYFTEQDCKVGNIGSGRLSNAESGRKAAETSIGKSNANTEPQMLNSSNDENVHLQLVSGKESGQLAENLWKNTVSNRFNTNQSSFEQPNEFCEYLNAITSSSNGAALHQDDSQRQPVHPKVTATLCQQFESKGGPLVPKFTPSARYRPRQMLSDFTPYKSSMNSVAQTIKRSTNQRRRQSLNKSSNRKRTADKPRWLLSNQNMGRRAIEVQVGHASHALEVGDGAKQNFELRQYQDERQPEKDSVWNPF